MVSIEAENLSIGCIFKYPNPIQRQKLENWANKRDEWEVADAEVNIGPLTGRQTTVAIKDRFELAYNERASLRHYGDAAFVTVQDNEGGKSEEIVSKIMELVELFEKNDIRDQLELFEVTTNGRARVSDDNDLSIFINSDKLKDLNNIHDSGLGKPGAIRFTSGKLGEEEQNQYYQLLMDVEASNNPAYWQFKYVRRYYDIEDYSKGVMYEDLHEAFDLTKVDTNA